MENYPIPMVPGPTSVPEEILKAYQHNYGSADMEPEFLDLYNQTEVNIQANFTNKKSSGNFNRRRHAGFLERIKKCHPAG